MAKRKTKKEKVIDLKPKVEKISDEHLNKMQEIINNLNRGQMEIGSIESRKHALLHHVTNFQDELASMQSELKKALIKKGYKLNRYVSNFIWKQ